MENLLSVALNRYSLLVLVPPITVVVALLAMVMRDLISSVLVSRIWASGCKQFYGSGERKPPLPGSVAWFVPRDQLNWGGALRRVVPLSGPWGGGRCPSGGFTRGQLPPPPELAQSFRAPAEPLAGRCCPPCPGRGDCDDERVIAGAGAFLPWGCSCTPASSPHVGFEAPCCGSRAWVTWLHTEQCVPLSREIPSASHTG